MSENSKIIFSQESDYRIQLSLLEYPISFDHDFFAKDNHWYVVHDDQLYFDNHIPNFMKEYIDRLEIKKLDKQHIREIVKFLYKNYDNQIPHYDWLNEAKKEFDNIFDESQKETFRLISPKDDQIYDQNLINYYDKNRDLFQRICLRVYDRNYIKQTYIKPTNIAEIIHYTVINMLSIFPIRNRSVIFTSFLVKNDANTSLNVDIATENIYSHITGHSGYKAAFKYQEMALYALYYCSIYNQQDNKLLIEQLTAISIYAQIASQLYGYVKSNAVPTDKVKGRYSQNKGDNKVYEYIQYRVWQYIKKSGLNQYMQFYYYMPAYEKLIGKPPETDNNDIKAYMEKINPHATDLDKLKIDIADHIMTNEGYFEVCRYRDANLGGYFNSFETYKTSSVVGSKSNSYKSAKSFETLSKIVKFYLKISCLPTPAMPIPIKLELTDSSNLYEIVEYLQTEHNIKLQDN